MKFDIRVTLVALLFLSKLFGKKSRQSFDYIALTLAVYITNPMVWFSRKQKDGAGDSVYDTLCLHIPFLIDQGRVLAHYPDGKTSDEVPLDGQKFVRFELVNLDFTGLDENYRKSRRS